MATENQSLPNLQDTTENQDYDSDHQSIIQSEAKIQESSSYPKVQIILEKVQDDEGTINTEKIALLNGNQQRHIDEDEESIQVVQEDDIEDVDDDQNQNKIDDNTNLPTVADQDVADTQQNQQLDQIGSIASLKRNDYYQGKWRYKLFIIIKFLWI